MPATSKALIAIALLVGAFAGAGVTAQLSPDATASVPLSAPAADANDGTGSALPGRSDASVGRFDSEAAFVDYLRAGRRLGGGHLRFDVQRGAPDVVLTAQEGATVSVDSGATTATAVETATAVPTATAGGDGGDNSKVRYSGTNVQEVGIDEPDLVKGDGETFFVANPRVRHPDPGDPDGDTTVVSASDPADPERIGDVEASGRLLLGNDTLVVLQADRLLGYDVSDPANPRRRWSHSLNGSVVTARLYAGHLYLVTRTTPSLDDPCPVEPLGGAASVPCTDVYRPRSQIPADTTYTALSLDPASGSVADSVSFVGTRSNSVVYASSDALYVTYTESSTRDDLYVEYLLRNVSLPADVTERLQELQSYDISSASLRREADVAVNRWLATLPADERKATRARIHEGFGDYLGARQRELVRTGIVRVDVDAASGSLTVGDAVGSVPGRPLNQFSLDEHEGRLRVATTVPGAGAAASANDLYVLDADSMDAVGSVTGMGLSERVYSVRYVGETAYVVTFRRTDPFHVVDLSDPTDPRTVGKLKLPGYSSYLHPIDDSYVLGLGREDRSVKAALFDVSDPANPTVVDDLHLREQWSAVARSHHAFLLDRKHGVFFLPTDEGGYVIAYDDGDLGVKTAVAVENARRARYVGDYLYVFGERELAVVNERTWDRTATVDLR
ncbi:MAG: beta-propeller domain-containing protein [Haloarculaceae archaeon]